jgi:hypothetical protein
VRDVEGVGPLDAAMRLDIARAGATLQSSLDNLADALTGTTPDAAPDAASDTTPTLRRYTRSSALFDRTERRLEERATRLEDGQLAIRDLSRIDGAMATLADLAELPVTDFDTVGAPVRGIG